MGNAALRELAAIEPITFDDLEGQILAIDAHNWLYRYLTITVRFTDSAVYTREDGTEVANLISILQGVAKLLEASITPVFVFDGEPSILKADEIERRREQREERAAAMERAAERGDHIEAARLDSQSQHLTEAIQTTSRAVLDRLDITYIDAPAEGESQAAHLERSGLVDAVGTEDYDALLFGAERTIRQLTSSGNPEEMRLSTTLQSLGLTHEQLVDVAILIGTDYNDGIDGYGPKTAVAAIEEHGDLWGVLEADDVVIERADQIRSLFLDPQTEAVDLEVNFPSPDIDAVRSFVSEEHEVDTDAIARPLERIESATRQTGLDQFS